MPPALLESQLATLEPLEADEDGIVTGIGSSPTEIADTVAERLGAALPLG